MILEKINKKVNLKKIQVVFLLEIGNRQEFQVTTGAWGSGRVVGRGEG